MKTGDLKPVRTVKTYGSNRYAHEAEILGPCKAVYLPAKPLSCEMRGGNDPSSSSEV